MNQNSIELEGVFPVLPTPFSQNGAINGTSMEKLVEFAKYAGVNGVVFPGFASEVSELTSNERKELLSIVVQNAGTTLTVVAGGSAEDAKQVIAHGSYAMDLGLNYLMIQPPLNIGNQFQAVCRFFDEITQSIPDQQIVLQNAPAPRGPDLPPKTICRLCEKFQQIKFVKEESLPSGPAISFLLENGPDSLLGVLGGGGARYVLDEYRRGACATMPALELADFHVRLDAAWRNGRTDEAREIYVKTLPLLTLQALYRTRLTKHVLMRRDVLTDTFVRMSTPDLDEVVIEDIENNLSELGILYENK